MNTLKSRWLLKVAAVVLTVANANAQSFSVLYNLGSKTGDPTEPKDLEILAQGRDGNLYGSGPDATADSGIGYGAVFKITPSGKLTVLHTFNGTDGSLPVGGLTLGTDGNFYGTTAEGTSIFGNVFKITPSGRLTVLHTFTNGSDGGFPFAPPIQGTDGNFYGTTSSGGKTNCYAGGGCGTVYRITSSGKFTTLYQFDRIHGMYPMAPLVEGADGNFYGTTYLGTQPGAVFKMSPAGKVTLLHYFNGTDGAQLMAPLIEGSKGTFYGTAFVGGKCSGINEGCGTAFKITSTGAFSVLHNMNGMPDGAWPFSGLFQTSDGALYGANSADGTQQFGTLFNLSLRGVLSVVHNFDDIHGSYPVSLPLQHTNGLVYGETKNGGTGLLCPGTDTCGVIYSLDLGLKPFVSLLPYAGKVGKNIEFLGQGFKGTKAVSFNGAAAKFTIVSDTYLTATVPSGATTGFVTVTTSQGTLKSNKEFRLMR